MRRQRVSAAQAGGGVAVANSNNVQTRQSPVTPQQKVAPATPKQIPASPMQKPAVQQQQQQKVVATPKPQVQAPFKQESKVDVKDDNNQTPQQMEFSQESGIESEPMQASEEGEEGGKGRKVRWFKSKKPSVRARERKMRQNRRLRKVLLPKNALMALNEIKGIKISEFVIESRREGGGFSAKVSVNNMQYDGIGNSKISAKNAACEKALRDHIIGRMLRKNLKPKSETTESNGNEDDESKEDVEMKDDDSDGKNTDEEDIPMLNLASFAIHKLFTDWEAEGFEIPDFRPNTTPTSANGKTTPPPPTIKRQELPANWESIHPTSLLNMMRPGIQYTYLGGEGQPPHTKQKIGITVDDENFIGEGRSQKVARRNAAVDACNKIFNTNFTKE